MKQGVFSGVDYCGKWRNGQLVRRYFKKMAIHKLTKHYCYYYAFIHVGGYQTQTSDPSIKRSQGNHEIKICLMKNHIWIHTTTSWHEVLPWLLEQNSTPNVPERNQFKRAIFQIHPIPTPSVATEFLLLLFFLLLLSACYSNLFRMPVVFDFYRVARDFFYLPKNKVKRT